MSRTAAVKNAQGRRIDRELAEQGIIATCRSWTGLAEEQPAAYKDVEPGGRRGASRRPGPQGRPHAAHRRGERVMGLAQPGRLGSGFAGDCVIGRANV